jgi:dTDP-glucose 4,6-dehydratase
MRQTRCLCTGGFGFIGSHLVDHLIANTNWEIVIIDKLTYASSGYDRLRDSFDLHKEKRIKVFTWDITIPILEGLAYEMGEFDYIFHLAAETHVDNSINDSEPFVLTNVLGTQRILEFARKQKKLKWMIYFSTDEVFGTASEWGTFKEWDRYNATNPYSASKAGGEELCIAYANTYKLPVFITHCMNVFGEKQHPEKFIPSTIKKVLDNQTVTIHSYPGNEQAGTRFYIHARNVASAIMFLIFKSEVGDKYNIVGEKEVTNLEMAQFIAKIIGKTLKYKMVDDVVNRPGHDLRYSLDGTKMKQLGWRLPKTFEESLEKTIKWYLDPKNERWLEW